MNYRPTSKLFLLKGIVVIILLSLSTAFGQNMVINPSFETAGTLQCSWYTTRAQYAAAAPGWTTPTEGSPDIFSSTLAATCYSATNSTHTDNPGQQAPRTGQRYTNVVVYGSGGCTPYREYIEGSLNAPLQVGTTYEVEMYVSLGDKATVATSNIGVKFGTNRVYVNTMCVNSLVPDVVYTGAPITDFTNWTRLVFYYTPTVANQLYFMIGNFTTDASTCTVPMQGGTKSTIRYYIDDVSIRPVDPSITVVGGVVNATVNVCDLPSSNLFDHLVGNLIPTNGTWSGPSTLGGGYLGTFNSASNVNGTYTYTWAGTGAPCAQGGVAHVTVVSGETNIIIDPLEDVCSSGANVPLNATPAGGTWTGTGVTNNTFNPATAGVGAHTLTYTVGGTCGGSETVTINVLDEPTATIEPVEPLCVNESAVNLVATVSNPNLVGTWSGPGVVGSTFDPQVAGLGSHTITYSIGGSCPGESSTTIDVNVGMTITIDPLPMMCFTDQAVPLNAAPAGGTWSGTGVSGNTFDPQSAGIGMHDVTYILGGICPTNATILVEVSNIGDATINPIQPVCLNSGLVNLTAVTAGGIWSGTGVTGSDFDPEVAGVGSHTITYTLGGSCPDEKTITIVVNELLDATINPLPMMCFTDQAVNLSAVTAGGTWSGIGVVGNTFNPQIAGIGTHDLTYTLNGLCSSSETIQVVVNNVGDATINPIQPVCLNNGLVNLTAVNAGGTWSGTGVTGSTFDPAVAGVGTHTITYTIDGSCPDEKTITITVIPAENATINPIETLCENQSPITLSAVQMGGTWSGPGVNGNTFDPLVAGMGTHTITYSIAGECPDEQTIQVVVNPMPVVNPTITPSEGCAPLLVHFSANVNPGATNEWKMLSLIHEVNKANFMDTISAVGCFDVRYTETLNGCSTSVLLEDAICVGIKPVAEFLPTVTFQEPHQSEFYMNNLSTNADTYSWSYAPIGSSTAENPSFVIPVWMGHVNVCLEASNNNSCKDEICKLIRAEEMLIYYVPNTFTPGGDEFNQTFQPVFYSGHDPFDFTMVIFDRWGEIVFETHDAKIGWDGTYNGVISQSGMYTYRIEFKTLASDERKTVVGHVNLLK